MIRSAKDKCRRGEEGGFRSSTLKPGRTFGLSAPRGRRLLPARSPWQSCIIQGRKGRGGGGGGWNRCAQACNWQNARLVIQQMPEGLVEGVDGEEAMGFTFTGSKFGWMTPLLGEAFLTSAMRPGRPLAAVAARRAPVQEGPRAADGSFRAAAEQQGGGGATGRQWRGGTAGFEVFYEGCCASLPM